MKRDFEYVNQSERDQRATLEHRDAELERRPGRSVPEHGVPQYRPQYRPQDFGTIQFAAFDPPPGGGSGHDGAVHHVADTGQAYQEAGPDFRYADTGFGYAGHPSMGQASQPTAGGREFPGSEAGPHPAGLAAGRPALGTAGRAAAGTIKQAAAATVSHATVGNAPGGHPAGVGVATDRPAAAMSGYQPAGTAEWPAVGAAGWPTPGSGSYPAAGTGSYPAAGTGSYQAAGTGGFATAGGTGFPPTGGHPVAGTGGYLGTGASGLPDAGVGGPDERTEVLINRGRRNVQRSGVRRWAAHWRSIAVVAAAAAVALIIAAVVLPGSSASWPASVATVQSEISVACQNPNVVSEPSQVNFACAKATRQVLWVFSLLTSGDNPAFTDSANGRKGLEPITPAQGGDIAWSLNLHHPYDPANPTDSLAVAARAINNIIGGATLTGSNGAPVVQPGLESTPANCARYTGSAALVTKQGFPALCALPIDSLSGQAALVSDVFQQWMVGTPAQVASEASVLFKNADNPGDSRVQAILNSLPDSGL